MNINWEIVNRALNKIGEEPILEEEKKEKTSTRIRLVYDFYLSTILETLHNTAWTSQIKRTKLICAEVENLTDYENVYILPIDCAKPIALKDNSEYKVEGNFLYTNSEENILIYVSNSKKIPIINDEETDTETDIELTENEENTEEIIEEDYPEYNEMIFDPLLSEYIETKLAAKMALKITGNNDIYQLLYQEAVIIENRAIKASMAHGASKDKGNRYWNDILGLPNYQ